MEQTENQSDVVMSELAEAVTPVSPPVLGPRLGKALIASGLFFVLMFGTSMVLVVYWMMNNLTVDNLLLTFIAQCVAWPGTILIGLWLIRRRWRDSYSLGSFPMRLLPGIVLGCFGLSFVLNRLATMVPMPEFFMKVFKGLAAGDPVLLFMTMVVMAPVFEELFFRGWMLRGFLANYSVKKSLWLSALIFALFHLNPWQGLVAFPLGLLFGWWLLRTGSLLPGMIGHFVVNLTNVYLVLPVCVWLGHEAEAIKEATHLPWDVVGFGAVLGAVGLWLVWRDLRSVDQSAAR
jgi:membrane protease YdiL (CAAX protease family)